MRRLILPFVGALAFAAGLLAQQHRAELPEDDWGLMQSPVMSSNVYPDSASFVEQRYGCRIARFGLNPWDKNNAQGEEWKRSTLAALMSMGLPLDVANQALQRIAMGAIDDTVGMGRSGGLATKGRDRYEPVFSTTYLKDGVRTVCHDSRVAVADGRAEYAHLYRVGPYSVAVFLRCGNVSRLIPIVPEVEVMMPPIERRPPGPVQVVHTVPEPGSLWLVALGLVGLLAARRAG